MSTAANSGERARIRSVRVDEKLISAHLVDGRIISLPIAWSRRLVSATPEQRARYRLIGDGEGIHWPDIDEDISVESMLASRSAAVNA